MDYDALTFDTQTVQSNSFHFDGGLLDQLRQFGSHGADVVVSLVVASEILRHLREATHEAKVAVENAHKRATLFGLKAEAEQPFAAALDTHTLARDRLQKYLKDIGATVIPPDDVPMRELVQAYFKATPPFAGSGKKKNEFPDAIALLSLERWAKVHGKRILAVSGDKDWAAFAEKSEVIDVVADLKDALTRLQEDADKAAVIAQELFAAIRDNKLPALADAFQNKLNDEISSMHVYPEAESYLSIESEEIEIIFQSYEFSELGKGVIAAQVVQAGPKIIAASVDLLVTIDATATFSLASYDSIDKDYVGMGSATVAKEGKEVEVTGLATFEGDFAKGEVVITQLELTDKPKILQFGYVVPDFGEQDYPDYDEELGQQPEDAADQAPDGDTPF
jgi:hypothetical protein